VSFSPAFKWFVILLVPLTLGLKLIGNETADEPQPDLVGFLWRHKFIITEQTIVGGLPVTHATADACQMIVVETSHDGWTRDIIRYIVGELERQFIVFRGKTYTEQPTWLTITAHWWSKALRQLGLARRDAPVFAVSATASCNAERLPWDELSS
jgi:hypothetical protein